MRTNWFLRIYKLFIETILCKLLCRPSLVVLPICDMKIFLFINVSFCNYRIQLLLNGLDYQWKSLNKNHWFSAIFRSHITILLIVCESTLTEDILFTTFVSCQATDINMRLFDKVRDKLHQMDSETPNEKFECVLGWTRFFSNAVRLPATTRGAIPDWTWCSPAIVFFIYSFNIIITNIYTHSWRQLLRASWDYKLFWNCCTGKIYPLTRMHIMSNNESIYNCC